MVTQERLKELFSYDPATGLFTRIKDVSTAKKGDVAKTMLRGYVVISIDDKDYRAHRLAFIYMNGKSPDVVDHINGNKSDNRFSNLRATNHITNSQNQRKATSRNSVGALGVSRANGKFKAQIQHLGKVIYLGCYETVDDAHQAYVRAKRIYHEGCTI